MNKFVMDSINEYDKLFSFNIEL